MDRNPVHMLSSGGSREIGTVTSARPSTSRLFEEMMRQMIAVDSVQAFNDIAEATSARERTAPSPARSEPTRSHRPATVGHYLEENTDTVDSEQGVKRRHRSCKVCVIYKVKPRKFTMYFCQCAFLVGDNCSVNKRLNRAVQHELQEHEADLAEVQALTIKLRTLTQSAKLRLKTDL
ncbi:hypothetical protein PPTG_24604 [Phytophthora nicotianae INRA-310]|uniref:Uncharacterized protein n=1 Tax=Phytophthora nicotianae (strain INRA-310) TaxID=761204 RepID=W2PET3_PHYN3|nr:hypothetical protein PPTG_24604 [Phytophthora nicotianae INRA-310]ETM98509.1 hypothetical protein PPTG_24604 [Phytophthora nicotianae INRA-310]